MLHKNHTDTLDCCNLKLSNYPQMIEVYKSFVELLDKFLDKGVNKHNFKERIIKRKVSKSTQKKSFEHITEKELR